MSANTRRWPTVNRMVAMIERRVCIRKIWRCNAGWGMTFVVPRSACEVVPQSKQELAHYGPGNKAVVYSYYNTLEQCVRAEYRVQVLKMTRPGRGWSGLTRATFVMGGAK